MIDKDAVLYYNGNLHRLKAVIDSAKATNYQTTVGINQLYDFRESHRAMVQTLPEKSLPEGTPTILVKNGDKYFMLTNADKINIDTKGDIEGFVISSVSLKNARLGENQVPAFVPKELLETCNTMRARQGLTPLRYAGSAASAQQNFPAPNKTFSDRRPSNTITRPQTTQRFGSRGR
jgi:hypothetical protein